MACLSLAAPGFIINLAATIILAVVVFCVPYVKSVYFLKATVNESNIVFGTLGYCLQMSGTTTCSKSSIGYQLDINNLVGNPLPIQIPPNFVKLVTTLLILHVIALVAAGGSIFFALLAHIPGMTIPCVRTCFLSLAAMFALPAFIFDLIFFSILKAGINTVGNAQTGIAIWLTLGAWVLLAFSGFLSCCG